MKYSLKVEKNLTLDDQKKIQLHTKEEGIFQHFIEQVMELGYEQTRDFYSLAWGFHHWHYRTADSLPLADLIVMLKSYGFEFKDAWEE